MAAAVSEGEVITSTVIPLAHRAQVHHFVWCAGVFMVLTAVWSGMRVYSRRARGMPLGIEDFLYYISVVCTAECSDCWRVSCLSVSQPVGGTLLT